MTLCLQMTLSAKQSIAMFICWGSSFQLFANGEITKCVPLVTPLDFWVCDCSGVTRGARGDIFLRAQHFVSAKLRSECYVIFTKCQWMTIITIYKMLNASCKTS